MRKFFKWLAIVITGIILLIVVLVGGFIGLRSMNLLISDDTMIARFPAPDHQPLKFEDMVLKVSPNQFLVCDSSYCGATPHLESRSYDMAVDDLRAALTGIIMDSPRVTHVITDQVLQQDDYIQRSAMIQYPDLITIRYVPITAMTSTLYIYSRSVYGYGDGGVNQARIEGWLLTLDAL